MPSRILIIEDDRELSRIMQLDLERSGYKTFIAENGVHGLRLFRDENPDAVILDVALPLIDGLTVCQRIREQSDVPILMMTAHAVSEDEIVAGLNIGADEYMIKPLRSHEFQARLRALLRRSQVNQQQSEPTITSYEDGYLSVNVPLRRVSVNGNELRLTPTEFKLLATFVQHPGEVLTFQQLLERVWGFEYNNEHHYPRIYVSHLRRKIEPDAAQPTYIHNEYGVGYRFVQRANS